MHQSKNLILRFFIIVLVWTNLVALSVSAQDVTQNLEYTRIVCVESVGCIYTHLRDETLDELFPNKERFTGIDQAIEGIWILDLEVTRECSDDPDIHTGSSDLQIWIYGEDETKQTIQVEATTFYSAISFHKIGAGMYVGELEIGDATTTGWQTYFLVQVEDDLLRGMSFLSLHNSEMDCYSSTLITGIPYQSP